MSPRQFEERHAQEWRDLNAVLTRIERGEPVHEANSAFLLGDLPARYRRVCHQLALARDRNYPLFIVEELHQLVERGHRALYRTKTRFWHAIWQYCAVGFPQLVRDEWRLLLLASGLFWGPLLGLLLGCLLLPELAYSVFDPSQVGAFERMYDPGNRVIGRERGGGDDWMMFGHYVKNNVGISFQVFAAGILFGVGSAFFLLYNGVVIGAIAGYLTAIGFGSTFWQFVCGHSSFELTAIVISGVAGLKLGVALLAPGQRTRRESLRIAAQTAVRLVYGVAAMLIIAAFIEAFWSSARWVASEVKYVVALVLWSAVIYYFTFQGRHRSGPETEDAA